MPAAQMMGADLAYMGTRFIATREALASSAYKTMLIDSTAADIVYTPAVSGVPASFLRPSLTAAGYDLAHLPTPDRPDLSEVTDPHGQGARASKAWRDVWSAGQGVGAIDDLPPVAELIGGLAAQYDAAVTDFRRASADFLPMASPHETP